MFYACKKWWNNERWIRLTDDDHNQQFIQLNTMQLGPMGAPQIVNSLAELDMDIVIDEGPDNATQMQDLYDTLQTIVPAIAPMLSPLEVRAVIAMLVNSSPLSAEAKKKFQQASMQAQQPDPTAASRPAGPAAGMADRGDGAANTSAAQHGQGADKAMRKPQAQKPMQPPKFELPPVLQVEQALSGIDKQRADAEHKRAVARAENTGTAIEPMNYAQRAMDAMHSTPTTRSICACVDTRPTRRSRGVSNQRERDMPGSQRSAKAGDVCGSQPDKSTIGIPQSVGAGVRRTRRPRAPSCRRACRQEPISRSAPTRSTTAAWSTIPSDLPEAI